MSTKTTFKRIALVAVAALGLGLMSVSSAPAAQNPSLVHLDGTARGTCNAAGLYACSNVADETSWVTINGTAHYGVQSTFMATVAGDTSTYAWSATSWPAAVAGWAVPVITSTRFAAQTTEGGYTPAPGSNGTPAAIGGAYDTGAIWGFAGSNNPVAAIAAAVSNGTTAVSGMSITTTATAAGGTIGQFYSAVTPTVAGTYVYTLKNALGGQVNTWTIKAYDTDAARDAAKAADNLSLNTVVASTSTSYLNLGETTTATADVAVSAAKLASATAQAATVVVTSKTAGSIDKTSVTALTATISGPGSLGIGTAANVASLVPTGRAITGTAGQNAIAIFADGTPGVATVTISAGTTVLGIETVTFYGDVASYTATVAKNTIPMGTTTSAVVAVVAKDKDGNVVPSQTVNVTASDATVVVATTATTSSAAEATAGTATVGVTGVADKFGKITLTFSDSTATIAATATAVVTLSSTTATTVSAAFDKTEYTPGEKMTLVVTAKDVNGLPVAPMDPIATLSANTSLFGFPAAFDTLTTNGSVSYTMYAPLIAGPITVTGTDSNTVAAVITASTSVVSDGLAQAAVDAAEEAIAAAEAATEAALTAAEAADAATTAAQDASDAVATLATQVTEQINALKAQNTALKSQITSLTNLIIKIQKKIGA